MMFAHRRPGWAARVVATTVVLAASELAAHVGAFAPVSHVARPRPLQLATGTCRLRARRPARFAMTAHHMPQSVDGALLEGLKQSAWAGKAPAIDRFNMQVNGPSFMLVAATAFGFTVPIQWCAPIARAYTTAWMRSTDVRSVPVRGHVRTARTSAQGHEMATLIRTTSGHALQVVNESPPIFRLPNFLSPEECDAIIKAAVEVRGRAPSSACVHVKSCESTAVL